MCMYDIELKSQLILYNYKVTVIYHFVAYIREVDSVVHAI